MGKDGLAFNFLVKDHDGFHLAITIFALNLGIDCPVKTIGEVMDKIHLGEGGGYLVGKPEDSRF